MKHGKRKALGPAEKLAALDAVVQALAHAARRQILLTLHFRGGKATAGEIAARFEHAWPTTTRHLQVLEQAGLLDHERDGRLRYYSLNHERLALVSEWLGWFSTESREPAHDAPVEAEASASLAPARASKRSPNRHPSDRDSSPPRVQRHPRARATPRHQQA